MRYISKYKRRMWGRVGYYRSKGMPKEKALKLAEQRTIEQYGLPAIKGIYGIKTNTERFRKGVAGIRAKTGISEREARKRLIKFIAFKKVAKLEPKSLKEWDREYDKISPH